MQIQKYIDHTLLKADATKDEIRTLCEEALNNDFAAVCINPYYVRLAKGLLKNSSVKICTVVGFPLGATPTQTKNDETKLALEQGADEIDMVINIGALKDKEDTYVKNEIATLAKTCHAHGKILKVIIETSLLTNEEKKRACLLAKEAKADFVKTSTGFSTAGATLSDVELMREVVGKDIGVKASGGVRDLEMAQKMIEAGATRLGTSSGIKIIQGFKTTGY